MMEISLDFSFLLNKENFNIKLIFDVWRHDGEKLSQTKITSIFCHCRVTSNPNQFIVRAMISAHNLLTCQIFS
jgi:hypothetical protein